MAVLWYEKAEGAIPNANGGIGTVRNRVLFLAALLVLSIVAGCGGGGGGSKSVLAVAGTAKVSSQAANPYVMVATSTGNTDESQLQAVSICKLPAKTGAPDQWGNYALAFRLELPSSPVVGSKYYLAVFNDKDGNGNYEPISQYADPAKAEFLGEWDMFLVWDGQKWSVVDPFGATPSWGSDATSTGNNIVVEAKYLE